MNALSHQLLVHGLPAALRLLSEEGFVHDRIVAMDNGKEAEQKSKQRGADEKVCHVTEEGQELPANPEPSPEQRRTL